MRLTALNEVIVCGTGAEAVCDLRTGWDTTRLVSVFCGSGTALAGGFFPCLKYEITGG